MRTKRAMLLGALGALAVAPGAGSALASGPAERFTEQVAGEQFICEDATYTVISGSIQVVTHEGESASGNGNFTFTVTPRNVIAEDEEGNVVSIRGAEWGGGAFNAGQGTEVFTFTDKFQLVQRGSGTVNDVNVTTHITSVNGNVKDFDFGNCQTPDEE